MTIHDKFRLDGKSALITGASRGIGLAAAKALSEAGADVTLTALSSEETSAAAAAIRAEGRKATSHVLDVREVKEFSQFVEAHGPFDVLVNNAGINRLAHCLDVSPVYFDDVMSTNTRGSFFLAQAVAKDLVARQRPGSIITMSSQMGVVGGVQRAAYCASKHAVEGYTKAMAIELGPHGIRVNTICPTFVETELTRPFFEDADFKASVLSKIKLGRIGLPDEVAGAVLYLASDASSLVTGSALKVDGGWTAE
ncbi:MAG: SDR family NAD(P)-dependent oxidoreductase [Pseudomonadota bacterium]